MTHSHPQGRPLSVGDLHAFTLKGFREIRAVGFCTYTMKNTGQKSGEDTVMLARAAYSAGMQSWAKMADTILGGRLLTLTCAGKEDVTVDIGDTKQLPGAAMEEFLGCTSAASAMGWTFTCSIGNDATTYLRHVIQQRWPGYGIATAKVGAAPKPVGGSSAAAAKEDTGRRGAPAAAAPTALSGAGKKPVKPGQVGVSREW